MGGGLISVKQGFSLRRAVFLHEVPGNCPLGALKSFSQIIQLECYSLRMGLGASVVDHEKVRFMLSST